MKKVELEDPELREKNGGEDFKKPQIYIEQLLQLSKESEHFDESAIKDEVYTIIFGVSSTLNHAMQQNFHSINFWVSL